MCYFTLPLSSLHPLPCPGAPEAPEAPIRPPFSPIFIFYLPAKRSRATTIQFTWNPPWSRTSIFTSASKVHLQQCRFPLMQFSFENHFLRLWSSRLAGWQRAFGECFLFNHKAGDCACVFQIVTWYTSVGVFLCFHLHHEPTTGGILPSRHCWGVGNHERERSQLFYWVPLRPGDDQNNPGLHSFNFISINTFMQRNFTGEIWLLQDDQLEGGPQRRDRVPPRRSHRRLC